MTGTAVICVLIPSDGLENHIIAKCDCIIGGTFGQLLGAVENGYLPEEYLDIAI